MKRNSLILLSTIIILGLCGCDNKSIVNGKTFKKYGSNVYYTDNRGNDININEYSFSEREKKIKEGYIKVESNELEYSYSFISKSVVKYTYKKNNTTINSNNCEYELEDKNTIKIKCNNSIKVFEYDDKNKCIINDNSEEYCID